MSLENPTYVGDLVAANPTANDPKSQGDDHIRRLKTALLNSFAGYTGAVCVTGVDGGVANAYTLTPAQALPAYGNKMIAVFVPTTYNTAASTLNISGLGAKAIKRIDGTDVIANDLVTGSVYSAAYNGTEFRLLSATKNYIDQLAFTSALPAQSLGVLQSSGTVSSFGKTTTGYALNAVKGADIASAATIDLTSATGEFVHVTGSVGITAITIPVGAERVVVFDGAPTITHSAALLLPGAVNITAAPGDKMTVRGDTAGALVIDYNGGIASTADVKAGTSSVKQVTPAALITAHGFGAYIQTSDQTITLGGLITIAHGLGRQPISISAYVKNITPEFNWLAGEVTEVFAGPMGTAGSQSGVAVWSDATNIYLRYCVVAPVISDKSGVGTTTLTPANWKFFLRAWA